MDNEYSNKLSQILKASGWSQELLASKLGVSFVTLNNWVNAKSQPRQSAKENIDIIYLEILGSDAIDAAKLKSLKSKAVAHKYTVKKLLNNRDVLEEITTSFTYHSNATEGSTMTEKDVAEVIFSNQTLKNRTALEQREAINHQSALYFLLDELAKNPANFEFTPDVIRAAHLRLMNGIISNAGEYRNHNVRVRGAYVPLANFIKIPDLLQGWCNHINEETSDKIALLAESHANFEKIHPFSDGNGRTGRLLLFILALKLGLVPPVLRKDRRFAYYKYLELAQTRDIYDPLESFISEEIINTATILDK